MDSPALPQFIDVKIPKQFCPHPPWDKQQAFLNLGCPEAFFGGAAGGGKSEALLMAALQYVHVPGYAALILRRDLRRLELSGGLIPRSHQWLTGNARWNGAMRRWMFPNGASLSFGYLLNPHDKYRYGSSEYQYIAFDELTEFAEDDYLFLFSRLRKTRGIDVPLRIRSASNPGHIGHLWVKNRFISAAALAATASAVNQPEVGSDANPRDLSELVFWKDDRAYVPAQIRDNPALDEQEYRSTLRHLPPLVRERLMNGDWSVREEGLIRPQWLRYYQMADKLVQVCDSQGIVTASFEFKPQQRLMTIDPAGTSEDRVRERRGRQASYSVVQVWDLIAGHRRPWMLLREQWRQRVGFDGLQDIVHDAYVDWQPQEMWIENEKLGQAMVDLFRDEWPIRCIATKGQDKIARAVTLLNKLERGEVYLPLHAPWRGELEAEWLAWSGDPAEPSDQIDAAAYAALLTLDAKGPVEMLAVW